MVRRAPEPRESNPPEPATPPTIAARWELRDWPAAAALFAATAAVVLSQNAHVAVLFDLSYILNTAERIALGQMPYRDFPLAHAPLTFLFQAAIIRFTGRVFFHHVLYAAAIGGLGTVLTWRIALASLRGRVAAAWMLALLLAAPLIFLGVYCIVPTPEYDCDCGFWLLVAIWFLQHFDAAPHPSRKNKDAATIHPTDEDPSVGTPVMGHPLDRRKSAAFAFAAGALGCVPVFFKQNMGLPFLLTALGAVLLLLVVTKLTPLHPAQATGAPCPSHLGTWDSTNLNPFLQSTPQSLVAFLAGSCAGLFVALLALECTVGLGNYLHWTIQYAGQRRLPGLSLMLGVYSDLTLAWTLPCVAVALLLLWLAHPSHIRVPHPRRVFVFAARVGSQSRWLRIAAFALLAAPFLFTLASLLIYDDADERGDSLLALWPLLLVLAAALALANFFRLRRQPSLRIFLPLLLLAVIHGTFLSQQLWGSTYGIWPLLILLLAELLAFLGSFTARANGHRWFTPALAAIVSITLLVCGGFYTVSEERLSYAKLPDGPAAHSAFPALASLATPGPYLPEIDELLRYAQANIPFGDGIVSVPGEEPFYFATGRAPQFPVPFFDPTIDPYSPSEIADLVRARKIRWLIVKTDVQTKEDPTPDRAELMKLLIQEFKLVAQLRGYNIYRRQGL